MIETVKEAWESFEGAVIPADAGSVQRTEMRRAFYGGAWSVLCEVRRIGEPDVSEADGVLALEKLIRECEEFARDELRIPR